MSKDYQDLIGLVPPAAGAVIDWDKILQSRFGAYLSKMAETPQNPAWHSEGDVLAHTKLVCENLIIMQEWKGLERRKREELFIAALLHDIGKTVCTRLENGEYVSPNHSAIGAGMVRTMLWKEFCICGSDEAQQFRECVCSLIRQHTRPVNTYFSDSPEYQAVRLSSIGELVRDFSCELLCVLTEADIRGRKSDDAKELSERLGYFKEVALEAGCYKEYLRFPSSFSRYAYLSGRNILPGQELYNDTWGTIILMSGLPGTGKDTYIKENYPGLPVISLDSLRKEMKISPTDEQGKIVQAAREQARVFLREKQPFVWNATNISPLIREKTIELCMDYKAMVKVVFLEAPWDEMLDRNQNRKDAVPQRAIEKMLDKLIPPDLSEAHEVEWVPQT